MFLLSLVVLTLTLAVKSNSNNVGSGVNYALNVDKAFHAALTKYHGESSLRRLLKRDSMSEYKKRKDKFRKSLEIVEDINAQKLPFSTRINFISVMTEEEEASLHNLPADAMATVKRDHRQNRWEKQQKTFRTVDWRVRNKEHKVYNQGACGSCWTFGANRGLESVYFAQTGESVKFSEQYLVDCYYPPYSKHNGCDGGWPHDAFLFYQKQGVVELEELYPYVAGVENCHKNVTNHLTKMRIVGYKELKSNAKALEQGLMESAVVVGIYASSTFNMYEEGIYECTESRFMCNMNINHAVTAVGYSSREWRVQNSWGPNWGMGGYIMLSRFQENILRIHDYMVVPQLECREGEVCNAPVFGDNYDKSEDEKPYDTGEAVKCGLIKHTSSDKCVDVVDTAETYLELSDICDRYFCFTRRGFIQDKGNYMCVSVNKDNKQLFEEKCRANSTRWDRTKLGFKTGKRQGTTIFVPVTDTPEEGELVVAKPGAYTNRTAMAMESEKCWEESDALKFRMSIQENGADLEFTSLNDAKEQCMEMKKCTGVMFNKFSKLYLLGSGRKTKKTRSGNKIWSVKECYLCCEAGKERCSDGTCRSECSAEDKGCPDGTVKCEDGVCRHEHLCA